jgi:hypothetical protein
MPEWNWTARFRGREVTGHSSGSQLVNPQALLDVLRWSQKNLDYSDFKCEQGPPRRILKPVPFEWFCFGTDRLKLEIDAGIRPFTDTIPDNYMNELSPLMIEQKPIQRNLIQRSQIVRPSPILRRVG